MTHYGLVVPDARDLQARIDAGERILVMYYAGWCGYCRIFIPEFERFAERSPIPAVGADVSSSRDPRWDTEGVDVVPTVVLYDDGKQVARLDAVSGIGIPPKLFHEFVDRHLPAGSGA